LILAAPAGHVRERQLEDLLPRGTQHLQLLERTPSRRGTFSEEVFQNIAYRVHVINPRMYDA